MKKLIINGIYGRMGKKVEEYADGFEVFGVDINADGKEPNISSTSAIFLPTLSLIFQARKLFLNC